MKTAVKRVLAVIAVMPLMLAVGIPAAHAGGYPVKCDKQSVLLVEYEQTTEDFVTIEFRSEDTPTPIQDAIDAAGGDATGSGIGDTVIVCPGTYFENIIVPGPPGGGDPADDPPAETHTNVSIRSWNGPHEVTIVGDLAVGPVVGIYANGGNFGGSGLGFTIVPTFDPTDALYDANAAVVQVGEPMPFDPDEDDDQEGECPPPFSPPGGDDEDECPDKELRPLMPINVTVAGNEILGDVTLPAGHNLAGIAVNNSNNTLTFRNLIKRLSVDGTGVVYGIRYGDTNSNISVFQNAVKELRQTGGDCNGVNIAEPTVGAVGLAAEDEALDATFFNNLVEKVEASCTAVGVFSSAWGGLENDRNGQQIPIVTDVVNNRIKKVESDLPFDENAPQAAGVVLAPDADATTLYDGDPYNEDDPRPPSSFRVSTNDIDDTTVGVATFGQLALYTYVEQNNFDNDEIGVFNNGNVDLDATNNYWGCDEGPYSSKNCAQIVTVLAGGGSTWATPWLKNHVDHAGAHAGDHAGHH